MSKASFFVGLLLPVFVGSAHAAGGRRLAVGDPFAIPPARSPITIDGDLQEWDESLARLLTLDKVSDSSARTVFIGYSAQVALQYDADALYLGVWWKDPTPLGPQQNATAMPPGDGLVLHFPGKRPMRLALWRTPGGTTSNAVWLEDKKPAAGVTQGFKLQGKSGYLQEVRIPWAALGGQPAAGKELRLAVDLSFGGFDASAGYKAFVQEVSRNGASVNRWGGMVAYGFTDGVATLDQPQTYDPGSGALLELKPAGSVAPSNPALLYRGDERTRTQRMIAVPAVVPPKLDGEISKGEWDPETGTTFSYEPTLYPNRYSGTIHWQYDAKGLYAGIVWRTGTSHANFNPVEGPQSLNRGFDGGDALQLRFSTDQYSHWDIWYHDASSQYGMSTVFGGKSVEGGKAIPRTKPVDTLAAGANVVVKDRPGGGYNQEIFLPWALLNEDKKPLVTGQSLRVILDPVFSGIQGNLVPFVLNTSLAQATGVAVLPYRAPKTGFYSLNIERETADPSQGRVIRRLLSYGKLQAGQTVDWDGLDDTGKVVPPGKYRFRGLYSDGIGLKYLTTVNNPGQPSWENEDGTGDWGGDHSPPQSVLATQDGVYLGWTGAEDGYGLIRTDFSGKKQWGKFGHDNQSLHIASDGQYVYTYDVNGITCRDPKTGSRAGFSLIQPKYDLGEFEYEARKRFYWWDIYQSGNFSLDNFAGHDDYYYSGHALNTTLFTGNTEAKSSICGLAAGDGKLYLSVRNANVIAVYDAKDMRPLARWKVPHPAGLAFRKLPGGGSALYALSGNSLLRFNTATGESATLVDGKLDAPVGLALDAAGQLYISQWGKAMCVRVFSAEGAPARTIGKVGGRPWLGNFEPNGMLLPRGIAVDKQNQLWVTENDNLPRRISVWNATTGELLREFIGGTVYGGSGGPIMDPKDSTRTIAAGTLFQIDLNDKEKPKPLATLWRRTSRDAFFMFGPGQGAMGNFTRYADFGGRRFIITTPRMGGPLVIGDLRSDNTWRPRAAFGLVPPPAYLPMNPENIAWRDPLYPELFTGHSGDNYIWTDLNGDGEVQAAEMQWKKGLTPFMAWGTGSVAKDFAVYLNNYRFTFGGFSETGAPQYDITKAEKIAIDPVYSQNSTVADSTGQVLTLASGERRTPKNRTVLAAYGPEGVRWLYDTSPDYRTMGQFTGESIIGPIDAGGEIGEIVAATQWHGTFVPLITTDGLFMGRLLRDPAEGGVSGPDMYRGETLQSMWKLNDGRVILSNGKNAHHLLELTGLESVRRFNGEFALSEEQSKKAQQRLDQGKVEAAAAAPILVKRDKAVPSIDGDLSDWNWEKSAKIADNASVALRSDEKTLYVAFKVNKGNPFINTEKQDATRLFLTGDAVDLQFTTDPAADPKRTSVTLGDRRLLFSRLDGKAVAVLYQAQVPGSKNPVPFTSPARTVTFDSVALVRDAKVSIVDTVDGYVVEAAVPVEAFAGRLWPGRVVQGDAGVVIADRTGRRVARHYRFNQKTVVVNDVPTEATLNPDQWGEIEVEP